MEQDPYQQRIEENSLRFKRSTARHQKRAKKPAAKEPPYRQVERLITTISAMAMEMGDWP
jgi:hypothetical protein